jgi:hypothetical protein
MKPVITGRVAVVSLFLLLLSSAAIAGDSVEDKIMRAKSSAPPAVSAEATVMDTDGTILVEGTNGWTCMPDTMPGDGSPMCNDEVWMKLMMAVGSQGEFETDRVGISYMLQGEGPGGGVSNSTPYHPDPKNADDYVETGPHMMIVVPKELLKGITQDPSGGGPYVMWGDTPYAHIMIPVALEGKGVVTK